MASKVLCVIRMRANITLPRFAAYLLILTLVILANDLCQASKSSDADLIIVKLDRILDTIGNLSAKYDHLEEILIQRDSKNNKHDTDDSKQNPTSTLTAAKLEHSDSKNKDFSSSALLNKAEFSNNQLEGLKETYQQESKDNQVSAKDPFHFNKLAQNSNTIPSSSMPWTSEDEGDLNEWLVSSPGQYLQHEQRQMMSSIGRQYEIMFGNALDNLNSVLKEQLAGFRLTLNKLMNRLVDHSYQYTMVANQLSLIKDECSLAASCSQNEKELLDNNTRKDEKTNRVDLESEPTTSSSLIGTSFQMRTSDISMMVRLISNELSQMLHQSYRYPNQGIDNERTFDQSAAIIETGKILNETRLYVTKKLNEIDSVVKQSASFLTKLKTRLPQLISIEKPLGSENQITITYNNSVGSELLKTAISEPVATLEAAQEETQSQISNPRPPTSKSTRWFPGSKVPTDKNGQWRPPLAIILNQPKEQILGRQHEQARSRCQSKTNLTLPTSCEQLRVYGANCTGQYYVFVRGEIRHVYCDMSGDNEEGWTVILRRLDKSFKDLHHSNENSTSSISTINHSDTSRISRVKAGGNKLLEALKSSQLNFNLDWLKYKNGFGQMNDWAEFFIGLDLLHQLTNDPSNETVTELQIDLETNESNEFHFRFDKFHVGDEESQYKLSIGACNESSACDPILAVNGSRFYTFDRINETKMVSCAADQGSEIQPWAWWLPDSFFQTETNFDVNNTCKAAKNFVTLTGPIGRQQKRKGIVDQIGGPKEQLHIYWPNWRHSSEPLKRVVMKVHRKRLVGSVSPSSWLPV